MLNRLHDLFSAHVSRKVVDELGPFIHARDRVLDVGSGKGYVAHGLATRVGCQVTTVDVQDLRRVGPPPILYEGNTLPFADRTFSVSLLISVLHHAEDADAVLREVARVTRVRILVIEDVPRRAFDRLLNYEHAVISRRRYGGTVTHRCDQEWKASFLRVGLRLAGSSRLPRFLDPSHPTAKRLYSLDPGQIEPDLVRFRPDTQASGPRSFQLAPVI